MINGVLKSVRTWSLALLYVVCGALGSLRYRNRRTRLLFLLELKRSFCRLGLRSLDVRLTTQGNEDAARAQGMLVVCNHVSYLDILILSSKLPCVFITAHEWRRAPLVGWMSRVAGSVFVRRHTRSQLRDEIDAVRRALEEGFTVVLFPEATSSDGSGLLPFKTSLFAAAQRAHSAVVPACIRYTMVDGEPLNDRTRRLVHFYRPHNFFIHALRLPFLGPIDATLTFLKPVAAGSGRSRKDVARECYDAISEALSR